MLRFRLGSLYATPGVLRVADTAHGSPAALLARHMLGDWGEVDAEDWATNDAAVAYGGRILSAYIVAGQRVWVITEAGRHATTVLLASEY
jgi:hypothetical protein